MHLEVFAHMEKEAKAIERENKMGINLENDGKLVGTAFKLYQNMERILTVGIAIVVLMVVYGMIFK